MARPSKYDPAMCQIVIDMMTDGASKIEVCAALGIVEDTFYRWQKDDDKPDFQDAIHHGELLSQAWWQRAGRSAVMGQIDGFNAASWIFNMKNRFKWSDNQKIEHTGPGGGAQVVLNGQLSEDQVKQHVSAALDQAENDV